MRMNEMGISKKQIDAITSLPGEKRFEHFIKVVVDGEQAWSLYQDGWALASNDEGVVVFPLWPAKEYARLCAENEWSGYEARAIPLDDLMGVLLPKLKGDKVLPGVFFTPSSKGVTPSIDELMAALEEELENY